MSIEISITQKGLLKKCLTTEIILGEKLNAGNFDGMRLDLENFDECDFIAYNQEHMGRGFSVVLDETKTKNVELRLLTPTSDEELKDFYDCVTRVMSVWNGKLEMDGVEKSLAELQKGYGDICNFNLDVLKNFSKQIIDGEHDNLDLFCARWPLSVGKEEAEKFASADSIELFSRWMHEKQIIDAYYAKPRFFIDKDDNVVGDYFITEGAVSIFPLKPYVPFGLIHPNTNEDLKCKIFNVHFYSLTEHTVIGKLNYADFIKSLKPEKVEKYDGGNILINALTLEEMNEILK